MEHARGKIILVCAFITAASAAALDIAVGAYGGVGFPFAMETKIENPRFDDSYDVYEVPTDLFGVHPAAMIRYTMGLKGRWGVEASAGYHLLKQSEKFDAVFGFGSETHPLSVPASYLIPITGGITFTPWGSRARVFGAAGGGLFIDKVGFKQVVMGWDYPSYTVGSVYIKSPGIYVGGGASYPLGAWTFGVIPRIYCLFNTGEYIARNADYHHRGSFQGNVIDEKTNVPVRKEFNDLIPVALFGVAYNF